MGGRLEEAREEGIRELQRQSCHDRKFKDLVSPLGTTEGQIYKHGTSYSIKHKEKDGLRAVRRLRATLIPIKSSLEVVAYSVHL